MASSSTSPTSERALDIPPAVGCEPGEPWTDAYFRSLIRGAIRQIYFRWPGRKHVMKRTRVEVLVRKKDNKGYKKQIWNRCEQCEVLGKEKLGKADKAAITAWKAECSRARKAGLELPPRPEAPLQIWCDHIDPVVNLDGTMPDWQQYIFRTFIDPHTGMQALCDVCHKAKTQAENAERRQNVKTMVGRNGKSDSSPTADDIE